MEPVGRIRASAESGIELLTALFENESNTICVPMTNSRKPTTPIDGSHPGAAALHVQAAQLDDVLEHLRNLTEPDSIEHATLVARLEKLLPDA